MFSAILLASACATPAPTKAPAAPAGSTSTPAAPPDTTEAPTADVRIVGYPDGSAQMSVSFDGDVPISPTEPARLTHTDLIFSAPIETPPFTSESPVVTSVTYRLGKAERRHAEIAGNNLELSLHDGTAYRRYTVRRSDFLE